MEASTLCCRAREKRQLNETYQRTQKLGDPDNEVDDVAAWVTKSRITAEEAKAAARAKAAAEARRRQEQEVRANSSGFLCPFVVGVCVVVCGAAHCCSGNQTANDHNWVPWAKAAEAQPEGGAARILRAGCHCWLLRLMTMSQRL